jgi:hypothetical protein
VLSSEDTGLLLTPSKHDLLINNPSSMNHLPFLILICFSLAYNYRYSALLLRIPFLGAPSSQFVFLKSMSLASLLLSSCESSVPDTVSWSKEKRQPAIRLQAPRVQAANKSCSP